MVHSQETKRGPPRQRQSGPNLRQLQQDDLGLDHLSAQIIEMVQSRLDDWTAIDDVSASMRADGGLSATASI